MKLLLVIFGIVSLCLANETGANCCPKDKETWCNIACYTCTDQDKLAMVKEQEAFDKFMDWLYKIDAFNQPVPIVNCTSGHPVPENITFIADMWQLRESMYAASLTYYQKCMNCTRNPTPVKFSKCSVNLRNSNADGLEAGLLRMEEYFQNVTKEHEKICNNLGIN
ncbi:hypothetical protein CBL_02140 [Carabus blaptoides fortunei]